MLNYTLLKNPINWAIVLLMTAIGFLAVDLVIRSTGVKTNG